MDPRPKCETQNYETPSRQHGKKIYVTSGGGMAFGHVEGMTRGRTEKAKLRLWARHWQEEEVRGPRLRKCLQTTSDQKASNPTRRDAQQDERMKSRSTAPAIRDVRIHTRNHFGL